ncbi:monofunctional biosynthetic peptidoglycan transglycosylase [filamentous cyanobacterium CCP2]|nr:monofunctional biosynthetic peptidoglycan transglycosylase [filamentous cyanobacterium CCP2]
MLLAILLSVLLVLPWRWIAPPTTSFMLQTLVAQSRPYRYQWVSYDNISSNMTLAAIAAEDQRFPVHRGFDLTELERAIEDYQQGGELRGASTISQQVAKNLYLWSGQTFVRKGLEAWFTVLIEVLWSKQRILEVYLNIAQFGDRVFGVEAASQQFFDHSAADLTAEEAALLAAVLPGPEIYFVDAPSAQVWRRQGWILQQMNQLGTVYLDELQSEN